MQRSHIEFLDATTGAFHLEHLVALAYIHHQGIHHQVGSKRDFGRIETILGQHILQQTGIEHDVTVVGHIKIGFVGLQLTQTLKREIIDAVADNLLIDYRHRAELEVMDIAIAQQQVSDRFYRPVRIDVGSQQRKRHAACDALHGRRYLLIIIGADVVKQTGLNHLAKVDIFADIYKRIGGLFSSLRKLPFEGNVQKNGQKVGDLNSFPYLCRL